MGISQWPNSPKYTDVGVINHLCLPAVIRLTFEESYFAFNVRRAALYQLTYICLAIAFRVKCTTINYVYILYWVCKWILVSYIYLYDDCFNTSREIHPSTQACVTVLIGEKGNLCKGIIS